MTEIIVNGISFAVFLWITYCLIMIGSRFYRMVNGRMRVLMYWKNYTLAWATFCYLLMTVLYLFDVIEIPLVMRVFSCIAMLPFIYVTHKFWKHIKRNQININE